MFRLFIILCVSSLFVSITAKSAQDLQFYWMPDQYDINEPTKVKVSWDLSKNSNSFQGLSLDNLKQRLYLYPVANSKSYQFLFAWPVELFNKPTFEFVALDGTRLAKYEYTNFQNIDKINLNTNSPSVLDSTGKTQAADSNIKKIIDLVKASAQFSEKDIVEISEKIIRFCVSESGRVDQSLRVCTPPLTIKKNENIYEVFWLAQEFKSRAILNEQPAPNTHSVALSAQESLSIHLETLNGISLTWRGIVPKIFIKGLKTNNDLQKELIIVGGVPPLEIKSWKKSIWEQFIQQPGFEYSYGGDEDHVIIQSAPDSLFYVKSKEAGLFQLDLTEQFYKVKDSKFTTMARELSMSYRPSRKVNIFQTDDENKINHQVAWEEKIPFKFQSYTVGFEDTTTKMKLVTESIHGFGHEIALKSEGFADASFNTGRLIDLGYSHWFEDLFSLKHSLTQMRWGIGINYLRAMTDFKLVTEKSDLNTYRPEFLSSYLRYRLDAGILNYHEAMGPSFAYQNIRINQIEATALGLGFFWGRPMPVVYDRIINFLPFLKYPKYLNFEFVEYLLPTNSQVQLKGLRSLNFQSKFFFKPQFFGDIGLGLRQIHFVDVLNNFGFQSNFFFVNAGLGYIF